VESHVDVVDGTGASPLSSFLSSSVHLATGGSRSLLLGYFVRWLASRASERPFRALCGTHQGFSWGALWPAQQGRALRAFAGELFQNENDWHVIPGGERERGVWR
jgi:hypothetical protein